MLISVADQSQHVIAFARDRAGLEVDIVGRSAGLVGGEQHSALEHQSVGPVR